MLELKIGTSWVRGVVGDALTPELAVEFACAFGSWAQGGPVVIGRDARRSSPMLRSAVVAGLLSPGCEVIDLGVCPTPLVSFAVRDLGAAGGIAVTGSHNDERWNALKFIGPDGALLNAVKSEELLDIYHARAFAHAPRHGLRSVADAPEVGDRYLESVLSALDVDAVRARGFRIAVDFCNGCCRAVLECLLDELGCELLALNAEPGARFPHAPSPSAETTRELESFMRENGAELGVGLNVDGDRLAFVIPGLGRLSEEYTLPLAAHARLDRRPGSIVTNLSTSRMVDVLAAARGQRVIRTAVGEGHVVDCGLAEGAVLAGEGNGGVAAIPIAMTFDAALTLATVLESLAVSGATLADVVGTLPHMAIRKGEIACSPDRVYRALESLRKSAAGERADLRDGVRIDWRDAWLHVRASNTEPLLRVIVEAESDERADTLFHEAMERGRDAVVPQARGGNP